MAHLTTVESHGFPKASAHLQTAYVNVGGRRVVFRANVKL